ncbi:MAG: DnaJ domain-containing protein [Hahellaceae bacterium]|nr:DnaJ domain-containing protein [Hahellaceae bacterium]
MYSEFIRQLKKAIWKILSDAPCQTISEYNLIRKLQQSPYYLFEALNFHLPAELFSAHFLLFHALYQIKEDLQKEQRKTVIINPLAISLVFSKRHGETEISEHQTTLQCDDHNEALRLYYSDLNNLHRTTEADINDMLLQLWTKLHSPTELEKHLKVLKLTPGVSFIDIKRRYRQLATIHHPDKGGCNTKQQELNSAMQFLKRYYST